MEKKWLSRINIVLGTLALVLLAWAGVVEWLRPSEILPETVVRRPKVLPAPAFQQPQTAYDNIGEPFLHLRYSNPTLQLPNLRQQLLYYGKNERSDADKSMPLLHFAFLGDKAITSALAGDPLYIIYDRQLNPARYRFSLNNMPTSLWIEAKSEGNQAKVELKMRGEHGEEIRKPEANANFILPEKDYSRFSGTPWEMGKWRVDATLLARQKARWQGQDLFLDTLGGTEFASQKGKQRIDLGEGADTYAIFAGPSSCFIWKEDRWQEATPGEGTRGYPLLCVKNIDARLMNLELWDINGKGKTNLNLLKSLEPGLNASSMRTFKFIGSRTLSQFLFEIDRKRVTLRPQDWLLQTEKGWIKLDTPKMIDDYVARQLVGPLFVFEGVVRVGDRQVVKGLLFNPSRTQMLSIELPLIQKGDSNKVEPVGTPVNTNNSANSNNPSTNPTNQTVPSAAPQKYMTPPNPLPGPHIEMQDDDDDDDDDDENEEELSPKLQINPPKAPERPAQRIKPVE